MYVHAHAHAHAHALHVHVWVPVLPQLLMLGVAVIPLHADYMYTSEVMLCCICTVSASLC